MYLDLRQVYYLNISMEIYHTDVYNLDYLYMIVEMSFGLFIIIHIFLFKNSFWKNKKKNKKRIKMTTALVDPLNPSHIEKILKSMSKEDREMLENFGKEYYGKFNFENPNTDTFVESAYKILIAIRSGLPIESLDENEVMLLENVFGSEWKKMLESVGL